MTRLEGKSWKIKSITRGKELMLVFTNNLTTYMLCFNFGKLGHFNIAPVGTDPETYIKSACLTFETQCGKVLYLKDIIHFSTWKWGDNWSIGKGYDIIFQNREWKLELQKYMRDKRKAKRYDRPIFISLLDQCLFNGIGNFTRSEILARCRFSPFTHLREVLSNEILRTEFFNVCYQVLDDIHFLGGCQFEDIWMNPFGINNTNFKRWIQVYNKSKSMKILDSKDREFFFKRSWRYEYILWRGTIEEHDPRLWPKIYRKQQQKGK